MTSNLISKNIDNYFNELINKQVVITSKKTTSFTIFYKDYIEHNLLLIFIIILMGIFLLFKYYSKDDEINYKIDNYTEEYDLIKNKKKKIKNKFKKERELLAKEKDEILSIIDELSELNFEKINSKSKNTNDYDNFINNNIDNHNIDNDIENDNCIDNKNLQNKNLQNNSFKVDPYINNNLSSEDYYNVTEKNSELINGIYFETPYN